MNLVNIPSPVHTSESNDCAICATQYVCQWFGIPEDRTEIKRLSKWSANSGACPPLEWLHKFGLVTPGWYCKGLDTTPDPDRPGVLLQLPTPENQDRLFAAYQEQLATGAIGLATVMIPAGCHEVVVIHAEPQTGNLWVVCSLRGLYKTHKSEFFAGPNGRLRGGAVWWVRRQAVSVAS